MKHSETKPNILGFECKRNSLRNRHSVLLSKMILMAYIYAFHYAIKLTLSNYGSEIYDIYFQRNFVIFGVNIL